MFQIANIACFFIFQNLISNFFIVTSSLFQIWCSSGVASAFPRCESIDFTGFSGILQDIAVADKEYFYHRFISPHIFCVSSQMLDFTGFSDYFKILCFQSIFSNRLILSHIFPCKIGKYVDKVNNPAANNGASSLQRYRATGYATLAALAKCLFFSRLARYSRKSTSVTFTSTIT